MRRAFGISALLIAGLASSAEPCCMVPRGYKGSISQSGQEALLFFRDGREDLILKIHYRIAGAEMPDRFAWIITVPNEPDAYAVADPKLFEKVHAWAMPLVDPPKPSEEGVATPAAKAEAPKGLEFGKAVTVGPYDIQPVRALGREALEGLNTWLSANGFPTEDPDHMAYFVDRKFTFLCVKVNPAAGEKAVSQAAGLDPLHLSFRTPQPYYPLRFSSRQGVFDVTLYVLTADHFDYRSSGDSLNRINWKDEGFVTNVSVSPGGFPRELALAYEKGGFKGIGSAWHLNVLRAYRVNQGNTITTWKEDIFFGTIAPPPFDAKILILAVAAVLVLGALVVVARRRNPVGSGNVQ